MILSKISTMYKESNYKRLKQTTNLRMERSKWDIYPKIPDYENKEETKKPDILENEKNDNNVTAQNEREKLDKRMAQLKVMAE